MGNHTVLCDVHVQTESAMPEWLKLAVVQQLVQTDFRSDPGAAGEARLFERAKSACEQIAPGLCARARARAGARPVCAVCARVFVFTVACACACVSV